MEYLSLRNRAIRYRGFLLMEQENQSWVVRPERSPIIIFPFKTTSCSLLEVKKLVDLKLSENTQILEAA